MNTFFMYKIAFLDCVSQTLLFIFICCNQADMKSYIPLETTAIYFLANLFLKQGNSSEYVMVHFICMGLLDLWGARYENYKMN